MKVFVMAQSLYPTQWKPTDTAGNDRATQRDFGGVAVLPEPHRLDGQLLFRVSFSGCLHECVRSDGRTDEEIGRAINISKGYMSKFLRSVGEAWARRLVKFMRETNCIAPLQKLADEMGCDLVMRSSKEARIRELEAQLEATRRAA